MKFTYFHDYAGLQATPGEPDKYFGTTLLFTYHSNGI